MRSPLRRSHLVVLTALLAPAVSVLAMGAIGATQLLRGAPARADDEEPRPAPATEIWRFEKGEAVRTVDVTSLPTLIREAVRARMAADGYTRVAGPGRGRDLEADARELVEHGGRFSPAEGDAAHAPGGDSPPGDRGVLLGARVRLEPFGEGAWLRVLGAPAGSLAGALGLVRGDRIVALDGRPPTLRALARYRAVERTPGQLLLGVLRRDGRTEEWTLAFSRGAPRARR